MKVNDFDKCNDKGQKGEKIIITKINRLYSIILEPFIKEYTFKTQPELQLKGKDGGIHFDWDVKSRDNSYSWVQDILLEIKVGKKKGWFYKDTDIIFYGILNREETDFLEEKAWILFLASCKEYFTEEKLEDYETKKSLSRRGSNKWWTINKVVPISDFPDNCLVSFPEEFWDTPKTIIPKRIGMDKWLKSDNNIESAFGG